MDFVKMLIDSKKLKDSCSFCFKCDKNNIDINTIYELYCEYSINISLSLKEILKSFIPFQDIPLRKLCYDCSDLVTKMYILVHKRKIKILILDTIVKQLEKQSNNCRSSEKKVFLNVKPPTFVNKNGTYSIANQEPEIPNDSIFNETKIICRICEQCFKTPENLNIHLLEHQQETTCSKCPQSFEYTNELISHLKTHQQKRKRKPKYYYCDNCNYKTLSKTTLCGHINKHHLQTRPHVCEVCFKGFYNKSNLVEHLTTHNSHRNQVCEVCGCNFFHKKNLIEHLRLHSNTRPYECNICSKRFVTSGRRSEHIKRSHMERTECCGICNKKYSLKRELKRHMSNVHMKIL